MSYLGYVARLFRNLLDAIRWAKRGCQAIERVNTEVQNSNASDALKAQSLAVKTAMEELCAALELYREELPGE
jgi:hypothetical protein